MDNWQPGDLALCVRPILSLRRCEITIVTEVCCGGTGLSVHGHKPVKHAFCATRFRKINPLTDEERREALQDLDVKVTA